MKYLIVFAVMFLEGCDAAQQQYECIQQDALEKGNKNQKQISFYEDTFMKTKHTPAPWTVDSI